MSCYTESDLQANAVDVAVAEKLRRALVETLQHRKLARMETELHSMRALPTIDRALLETLSVTCAEILDVDGAAPSDYATRFFKPCDWPQDWLEFEVKTNSAVWLKMDHLDLYSGNNLLFPMHKAEWFASGLSELHDNCPDMWDVYSDPIEIVKEIGLDLPRRQFRRRPSRGPHDYYYEYEGMWAYFASLQSDKPHAQCMIVDSGAGAQLTPQTLLRSELEAALCLCRYQLRDGLFTDHHTKPVLVATILRDQTARLTEAVFNSRLDMLVLRQSRVLDLSGPKPGPDAWTLMRWLASTPLGLTKYPELSSSVKGQSRDDQADLAPSIVVSGAQ